MDGEEDAIFARPDYINEALLGPNGLNRGLQGESV
jgi:hypothetical protein